MDERGSGFTSTAFFARIRLHGRFHPALFTAGHVFDLTESGVDSRGLEKVHLIFNNLKVRAAPHPEQSFGHCSNSHRLGFWNPVTLVSMTKLLRITPGQGLFPRHIHFFQGRDEVHSRRKLGSEPIRLKVNISA